MLSSSKRRQGNRRDLPGKWNQGANDGQDFRDEPVGGGEIIRIE